MTSPEFALESSIAKTEKQKMLGGELYSAFDSELCAERQRASRLVRLYNNTTEDEWEQRFQILPELFGKALSRVIILPPFRCDYGTNIYPGDGLFLNYDCVILDCNPVSFGDNVMCGPSVHIYTASHPIDPTVRLTRLGLGAPVTIGSNVWIGGGVIICPGVAIGDNTTIGAGSVVTKDIPANVVAAGNPCRVIKPVPTDPAKLSL